MRFSRSTHLLMCLPLETLTSIIRTGLPIPVELIDLVNFPSYSQWNVPFHRIAYDYSHADWSSLQVHLRDVPWENIFKLGASAAASEFCGWVQVGIDVYILLRKYQVKPHSSALFSAASPAGIADRNHFFRLSTE